MASGNTASAPASTQATSRAIISSRPSLASASLRAMMTKLASLRASTAALTRSTISSLRHHFLAGAMAAALGLHLVFDVQAGGAGLDERAHGARDVERAAPARVGVHQQRQGARLGNAPDVDEHVVHGADAEIGQAERIRGHAAAG